LFEWSDLLTILVLIVLEGLLSGDNALVLAVIVMPLPEAEQRRALRYGIIGAFVLRTIATFLAVWLVQVKWVSLVGGLYLLWLPFKHFTQHDDEHGGEGARTAAVAGFLGLSLFWSTVVKVELVDLVFAVDSILAAVGLTKKIWVIVTGGVLGIIMMRLLTGYVLTLVKRYPKLIDGAYIVVAWVGLKLVLEYLHDLNINATVLGTHVEFEGHRWFPHISHEVGVGVVVVLFTGCLLYARAHGNPALSQTADDAAAMMADADRAEPRRENAPAELDLREPEEAPEPDTPAPRA
jgi:YkoY family integral membrane protein